MKKTLKKLVGAAAAAGAAYLTVGEALYETFLNVRVQRRLSEKGFLQDEEEKKFWDGNREFHDGLAWFKSLNLEDVSIPSRLGGDVFANIIPAREKSSKWAIILHGYTSRPSAMAVYARKYLDDGFNVLLPHMVGHSPDPSKYCSMGVKDKYLVLDWINYVAAKDPDAKILLHGVSMGAATVMLVTGEPLPDSVVCAISDCGYTSCWEEYAGQLKEMFKLPAFPLLYAANAVSKLRGNFDFKKCDPQSAVERSKTPTLFIHGEDDDFVPFEMLERVYQSCSAPRKEKLAVPGAFHASSAFIRPELYWKTTDEFIAKCF